MERRSSGLDALRGSVLADMGQLAAKHGWWHGRLDHSEAPFAWQCGKDLLAPVEEASSADEYDGFHVTRHQTSEQVDDSDVNVWALSQREE
jgi:hypothetical protein